MDKEQKIHYAIIGLLSVAVVLLLVHMNQMKSKEKSQDKKEKYASVVTSFVGPDLVKAGPNAIFDRQLAAASAGGASILNADGQVQLGFSGVAANPISTPTDVSYWSQK